MSENKRIQMEEYMRWEDVTLVNPSKEEVKHFLQVYGWEFQHDGKDDVAYLRSCRITLDDTTLHICVDDVNALFVGYTMNIVVAYKGMVLRGKTSFSKPYIATSKGLTFVVG